MLFVTNGEAETVLIGEKVADFLDGGVVKMFRSNK